MFRQLLILLKPSNFGLAVRNIYSDVGEVLLNEMWEREDSLLFSCPECCDTFNFVVSILNFSLQGGDSSQYVHDGRSRAGLGAINEGVINEGVMGMFQQLSPRVQAFHFQPDFRPLDGSDGFFQRASSSNLSAQEFSSIDSLRPTHV